MNQSPENTPPSRSPKRAIEVFFGGASSERLVSTASAQNMVANLPTANAWFIAPSGTLALCAREHLLAHPNPFKNAYVPAPVAGAASFASIEDAIASGRFRDSVIVLGLHGEGVEDGVLQAKFERAGIPFTGSGSTASRLAFDKLRSKECAVSSGVRVAESRTVPSDTAANIRAFLTRAIVDFERVAVKPIADGSSVGLYILDGRADLAKTADAIYASGRRYMLESFIAGTELTVGIVDDGERVRALPPSEVRLADDANFDYDAKYLGRGVEELTPARVSPETTAAAQALALIMHRALGCSGYSRTDLIVTRDGPVYLETNTLPGMTRASFLPQQLVAEGRTVAEFLETEIARAIAATSAGTSVKGRSTFAVP